MGDKGRGWETREKGRREGRDREKEGGKGHVRGHVVDEVHVMGKGQWRQWRREN